MLKVQLHIHTSEDKLDGDLGYNAKELIDNAEKLGFDVLAFTFHEDFFYPKDIVEYAKKKGILLIPGIELKVEGKHVLVYGVKENLKVDKIKDLKNLKNVLVVAAHPYFPREHCLHGKLIKNIDVFDAIEYSSFYLGFWNFNKRAVKAAKKFNKVLIGNGDVHDLRILDKTYSLVDAEKNIESVLNAIKKGKVEIKTRPLKLLFFTFYMLRIHLKMVFKLVYGQ